MTGNLPEYPRNLEDPKKWNSLDITQQYTRFDTLLTQAQKKSIFHTLPDSPGASLTRRFEKQGETMAEQLWLLGYLKAPTKQGARGIFHRNRPDFLDAAGRFQKEAGLKPDKWTGRKTRDALDNLVSFESDHLNQTWLDFPQAHPAVLRAIQCRLFVLGLAGERPGQNFSAVPFSALKKFKCLALALGALTLEPDEIKPFLDTSFPTPELLSLILDQDSLIKAVAESCKEEPAGLCFDIPTRDKSHRYLPQKYQIRRFLTRLAQVEFWLMGYEIRLTASLPYPVKGIDEGNVHSCDPEMKEILMDFAGLAGKAKNTWTRQITPELFILFHKAALAQDEADLYTQIQKRLTAPKAVESALTKGRQIHLRLWDGIKRVMRWIKRLITKTAETILDLGRNIARFFYKYSLQAFETVTQALAIAARSIETLNGTDYRSPDYFIHTSCNGKMVIGLSPEARAVHASRTITRLHLNAERFCLAARICALLLSALVNTVFSQWIALAKALFDNGRACIRLMKKIYTLENRMDALSGNGLQ